MQMHMFYDSSSRRLTDVYTYIEALGVVFLTQQGHQLRGQLHQHVALGVLYEEKLAAGHGTVLGRAGGDDELGGLGGDDDLRNPGVGGVGGEILEFRLPFLLHFLPLLLELSRLGVDAVLHSHQPLAVDRLAGGAHRESAGGRYPERVHRLGERAEARQDGLGDRLGIPAGHGAGGGNRT